jgi:hypothetical protein
MDHDDHGKPAMSATIAANETPPAGRRGRRRALKVASPDEFDAKSRVFMYGMAEMLCRILPAYNEFFHGDMAKLLIVNAVAAANVQRLMATLEGQVYDSLESRIPAERQVPANALSIADATGMPRETVRRKLKELVAAEILMVDARGGYRLKPGAIQTPELAEIFLANFRAFADLMERCLDAGLVEVQGG